MELSVNVAIAVYNQSGYLRQCIDSVIAQKTTFPLKIIIGDDCSTDNSAEIIKEYELLYPDKIRAIYQKKNLGLYSPERNGIIIINECTSKYIALLDGDDYWTDPLKLQKQVDFLEKNLDFAFCYHHVNVIQENGFANQKFEMKKHQPELSTIENILKLNIWPHINSILYRRENMPVCPKWLYTCPSTDWAIWIIITGNKKIRYLPETMSVYRQHSQGFWNSNTKIQNAHRTLKSAKILKKYLVKGELRKHLYLPIHYSYIELINHYRKKNIMMLFYYSILSKLLDLSNALTIKREIAAELTKKELLRKIGSVVMRKLNLTNSN